MKIGSFTQTSDSIITSMNKFQKEADKSLKRLQTGKNLPTDNPASIGRAENYKAVINSSKVAQNSLGLGKIRNAVMENTLASESLSANTLSTLAAGLLAPGADKTAIKGQAAKILEYMAGQMKNTMYNGVNPFTQGDVTYTVSGGTETFQTPKFNIEANATDPTKYDITLSDGTKLTAQTVDTILTGSYIATNLQNPISSADSTLAVNDNIIDKSIDYESNNEAIFKGALSDVEDVNVDKETANYIKNNTLAQTNSQLLSVYASSFTSSVGRLLDTLR